MRILFVIMLLLFGVMGFCQEDTTKYMKYPNSYGPQYKDIWATRVMRIPDTTNNHPQQGVPGAIGRNTDGTSIFVWDGSQWQAGTGGVQIDSVIITSIDSLFITNTDSIFIVGGTDTIFVGMSNPGVDTIYQRGDSIFAVKSGVEFLAALTGGEPGPPGTRDTLWYNVKWFGALGDGVTDDRAAIQLADDYVSSIGGGYMWFPAGTYIVSSGIYRHSYVNWEGVKDGSIIKNTAPEQVSFGAQSVMWMGNYNPSAYDTTVARFYRGHMGTYGNKMAIVDSISRFNVGDIVVIESMTGWESNDGHWKPYVVRFNEVDSVYDDTVVFHYQIDTILTDARINISGHFINPANGIDNNGHAKYLVKNITTRNLVFESEGQWILGMSSLGCSWENIRVRAAELFTGNGMAWTTARNIYGQWWKQVSEFAIGCHNTTITGVNAHYINKVDEEQKPYIKFGENVHAVVLKDVFVDAGNFDGNGIWFGASTECIVDGIHTTSVRLRKTHIEFSDNDLITGSGSYVNNNIVRHGYFKNAGNLQYYVLMEKAETTGQLKNNVVSDVTFIGPVADETALTLDGYRPELKDLYTTEGEINGGDSLYKGIVSGGAIANIYDIHGNDSNVFIRSVFDTSGKNRSHFADITLKYIPDDITIDGQLHYNQPLDQLNFRHNGVTTDLLNPSTPITLQPHSPGFGILGSDYDGTTPQTWALDTSVLNTVIFTDSADIEFIVDSIANAPLGTEASGTKYLVGTSPTGAFAGHANEIAELVGAVWSFTVPTAGDDLIVSNATQPTSFYHFNGTNWILYKRALSIGGDRINARIDIGTLDNQTLRFITNGAYREQIAASGHFFNRYRGVSSNNYLKIVDTATGRMDTASFTQLVGVAPITVSNDTVYHNTTAVTPGSYTNTNLTVDAYGHITAAANGTGGSGGGIGAVYAGTGLTKVNDSTLSLTTPVSIANGGTNNGSLAVTAGGVLYTDGSKVMNVGAGTTGQVLIGGTTPSWSTNQFFDTSRAYIWTSATGHTWRINSLGASVQEAVTLADTTLATNVLQQNSPALYMYGSGWNSTGSTSSAIGFKQYVVPSSGSTAGGQLRWGFYRGHSVISASLMTLSSAGTLSTSTGDFNSGVNTSVVHTNSTNGSLVLQNDSYNSNGGNPAVVTGGTVTQTSGTFMGLAVSPIYNETGSTAANTALRIQPLETSLGSGAQYFFEAGTRATSTFTSTFTQKFYITNAGTVGLFRPLLTNGSTPSNSAGTGAGTGPTISVTGNDIAGRVSIATGTSPTASGDIVTITFATTLTNTPTSIVLTAANANAAGEIAKFYVDQSSVSSSSFKIKNTSSALTASTTYLFYYTVYQ